MRHRLRLTAAVVCAAATASCSSTVGGHGTSLTQTAPPSSGAPVATLQFSDCGFNLAVVPLPAARRADLTFGCAELRVPRDYAHESGPSLTLELIKVHDKTNKSGKNLVVNPGGPGGSGIEAAVGLAVQVSDTLLSNFDLIGFDPRGVGLSAPIRCYTDEQKDVANAAYFDVRTESGFTGAKAAAKQFADACESKYGAGLADFNTVQTAKDMDRLRAALGDDELNYLGFSYGTELGAVYAHLFPRQLGAAVLDGAVDPLTDATTSFGDQVKGFEGAFDQFAADCVKAKPCTIGNPRRDVDELVSAATTAPIASGSARDHRKATVSLILTGVIGALYSRDSWPKLGQAITLALSGRSEGLLQLADQYNERASDGTYTNILDANNTISCNDSPPGPTDAQIRSTATEWAQKYPMFGLWAAQSFFGCQQWQPDRTPVPKPTAATLEKVLVVGNLHDPATPYQGAKDLTTTLGNAELLTWDGQGHTSYLSGSKCIDNYVDSYLVSGTLPPDRTTCPR